MKKKKVIVPNIIAGGTAVPLGSNYYLMRGRKHEEGGIDVGANPRTGLEVEDGEIMQLKDKEVRVFSTVPFLNGQSPAQKVMGGENPNKVFAQQEAYKDRNNINDDGTRKAKYGVWDKLDNFANDAEIGLGVAGLGLLGATAVAPNPYTLGASYLTSLASGGIDIYQGIRSGIKGDWKGVAKNAGDLGLSLIGAKAIKGAKNAIVLDRTLTATNAPRQMVTRTVGRGRGRRKVTTTKEYTDYMNKSLIGYGSTAGSDIMSLIRVPENQPNVLPTVVVTAKKGYGGSHSLNTKYKQKQIIDMKDNNSRTKAKAGLRYILQTNGRNKLGYVPSTGESLSGAKGRDKAELGSEYILDGNKKDIIIPHFISTDNNIPSKIKPLNIKPIPGKSFNTNGYAEPSFWDKTKDWINKNPNTTSDIASAISNIGGGLASYFINKDMLKDLSYDRKPVPRIAPKLKTNININPQLDKMREALATYERNIDANTASSQVALARKQKARANALSGYNELYGYKENAETELINKDRLNQQEVANQSIADYNSYIENKMNFDNAVREKQADNAVNLVNNLNKTFQGLITTGEKRKADKMNALAIMAANPNVNPRILREIGITSITDEMVENWEKINLKKG